MSPTEREKTTPVAERQRHLPQHPGMNTVPAAERGPSLAIDTNRVVVQREAILHARPNKRTLPASP
jgi:hypothetical protein